MKIAVTGSRVMPTGTEEKVIDWVNGLPVTATLYHGGAKGVDRTARDAAKARGLSVKAVTPSYSEFPGELAPLIRNAEMVSMADELHGFWHGMPYGGTANALWTFQALNGRSPTWTLIGIVENAEEAFRSLVRSPPDHWIKAFGMWRKTKENA